MSYPPPLYHGEAGEVSAHLVRAATEPAVVYPNGNQVFYLARGTQTAGTFGLYRWEMGPEPTGPGPHFHRSITESFYVLSGTVRLHDGSSWVDGRPGDFFHVPIGGVHGFRNESGEPAAMLLLFTPGAPREDYFETLASGAAMSEEERADFMLRHDTYWL